jgi:signal transduction histidine kinase
MGIYAKDLDFHRWLGKLGITRPATGGTLLPLLLTVGMFTAASMLHYGDQVPLLAEAAHRSPLATSTRQSMERILILVPIVYATFVFGAQGGIVTAMAAFTMLFPRALVETQHTDHALPELAGVMMVASLLIIAIVQQRREAEAQEKMRDSLQFFVRQVLTSQEDERKRIAQELHDDTAQVLLLACQRLDRIVSGNADGIPPEAAAELGDLRAEMVRALTDLRRMTQHLRPRIFDDHGLVPALEWLADSMQEQFGIQAKVNVIGPLSEHSPEIQLLLFRIAQEALRNVGKHSQASEAVVTLRRAEGRIVLSVADDGRGFRLSTPLGDLAEAGRLGLLGMSERARLVGGTFQIRTAPGAGTTITAELPCSPPLAGSIPSHGALPMESVGSAEPVT